MYIGVCWGGGGGRGGKAGPLPLVHPCYRILFDHHSLEAAISKLCSFLEQETQPKRLAKQCCTANGKHISYSDERKNKTDCCKCFSEKEQEELFINTYYFSEMRAKLKLLDD